ncbi:MAG: ABC transporter permease [Bacteroidales bacterium]|nr:ABC transporter permease [Bacteroidales bacterium]
MNENKNTGHVKQKLKTGASLFLILFIVSAFLGVAANVVEWEIMKKFSVFIMWTSLPCYFIFSMLYVSSKSNNLSGRFFSIVTFFPLVLFISLAFFLIITDAMYIDKDAVIKVLHSSFIRDALQLSIVTSVTTVMIALIFAIPMGYALSRYRFPGHLFADTIVDIPIVFPPLVAGLTLLVFFSETGIGRWIQEDLGLEFVFQPKGIVLCQFIVSASFAIRSIKSAFDDVDKRLENVALTLGCSRWGSFLRVSLPMASGGIMAGAILTWARAFGIFGPLMILVGSFRGRTEVLSTTIYLEQSVGNLEVALAVALLLIFVAIISLGTIRLLGGRALVKL